MLRKKIAIAIIAGAGSLLLAGGMASAADESCFPSSSSECGVEWGTTPTTLYERPAVPAGPAGAAAESCFPSSSSECGVEWGTTPTTSYERAPVGATGIGAAGGETGPVEVLTPGYEFSPIDD